jgi:hypothetical protein
MSDSFWVVFNLFIFVVIIDGFVKIIRGKV